MRSRAAGAGKDAAQTPTHELAAEEDYWSQIQRAFDVDRSRINFNNGGVAPCPSHVLDQMIRDLRFTNEMPALHMWNVLEPRAESVRRYLLVSSAVPRKSWPLPETPRRGWRP